MARYYDPAEVKATLAAYRALFPVETAALRRYWDLDREQPWGGLTTDFWRAGYPELAAFHAGYVSPTGTAAERGAALARYQAKGPVGYAIGLSPWTDRLLLDTYRPGRPVVLVLGHDWHPIASDYEGGGTDHAASPLEVAELGPNYRRALPPGESTLLFLNLYPHFRAPGASPMGRIPGVDYRAAVAGLHAVGDALTASGHRLAGVIGWGSVVWQALGGVGGISQAWQRGPVPFLLGGQEVSLYPSLHPSAYPFGTAAHREAYQAAWAALAGQARV